LRPSIPCIKVYNIPSKISNPVLQISGKREGAIRKNPSLSPRPGAVEQKEKRNEMEGVTCTITWSLAAAI
jgi:hypothetical protein